MTRAEMPLHIPDYRADTGHLSTLEHGAYLLLIMHYWMTGGLPDDDARLARITGMGLQEWTEAKPALEPLFTAGWRHKRVERELRKVQVSEVRSEAGKAGADARWHPDFANGKTKSASLSLESKNKKKERGARLANDWSPSVSDTDAARAEGFSESEISREVAKFRDYWTAKSGSAGVKLDWSATWRNWCRRAAEYAGKEPQAKVNGPIVPSEMAVKLFKSTGKWHRDYGPEPGQVGCRALPEILRAHGYVSDDRTERSPTAEFVSG